MVMEHISRDNFSLLVDVLSAAASMFTMWVLFQSRVPPAKGMGVGTQTVVPEEEDCAHSYYSDSDLHDGSSSSDSSSGSFDPTSKSYTDSDSTVSDEGDMDILTRGSIGPIGPTGSITPIESISPIDHIGIHPRAGLLLQSSGLWDNPGKQSPFLQRPECPDFISHGEDHVESSGNDNECIVPELISMDF